MANKYRIHLECRESGANYGNEQLYTEEEYSEFIQNLTDTNKDFVGIKSWKDTWHYVQKIKIVRVEVKVRKSKEV
jgi:hypothetical protein